jgi:hypothetical protein
VDQSGETHLDAKTKWLGKKEGLPQAKRLAVHSLYKRTLALHEKQARDKNSWTPTDTEELCKILRTIISANKGDTEAKKVAIVQQRMKDQAAKRAGRSKYFPEPEDDPCSRSDEARVGDDTIDDLFAQIEEEEG